MNKIRILTTLLSFLGIILLLAGGCTSPKEQENPFGIYLLAQNIPTNQITSVDLNTLELQDEPLISINDIISYNQETHEIKLTDKKAEEIGSLRPPTSGTPFVGCVGSERIYGGALWPGYSSSLFDGIVLDPIMADFPAFNHTVHLSFLLHSESVYNGADPRSDPRILESLEQSGKLIRVH